MSHLLEARQGPESDVPTVVLVHGAFAESAVLLVGHSCGGAVMTNAVGAASNVRGLVYIAGFAPDTGENIGELSARLPGSTLGGNVYAVPSPNGSNDLYIRQDQLSPPVLCRRG